MSYTALLITYFLREAAKKVPPLREGEGKGWTTKEKELSLSLFLFQINKNTYFTLTILRFCQNIMSVGKVAVFSQVFCNIWHRLPLSLMGGG